MPGLPRGGRRPSPAATRAAEALVDVGQVLEHAFPDRLLEHLPSSKVNASTMWSCSTRVMLSQNSVAWLKWSSNEAGLLADLLAVDRRGTWT